VPRSPVGPTGLRRSPTTSTPTGSSGATSRSPQPSRSQATRSTADLTESAPMVAGALNSTRSFIQACVYQAVRSALDRRDPEHVGRVSPDPRADEAGDDRARRPCRGASSMRGRDRLPRARRGERRASAADPGSRAGSGRGGQHARGLRRRGAPTARASSITSSSSAPGAERRKTTANDGITNPARPCGEHPGRGCGIRVPES